MAHNSIDRAFKVLINKEVTADETAKKYLNEFGANTINMHFNELWAEKIDIDPSISVTANIIEKKELFTLTLNPTVTNNQCYNAMKNDVKLRDWVNDKYGSAYVVKLYDNNDNEIPPTDSCDWFFDYMTGILTFNGSTSSFAKPFKITGYRYIGKKGFQGALDGDDMIRIITFPKGTRPYNKSLSLSIPDIIGVYPLEFNLSTMPVANMYVELAKYSFACTGYHDGDFMNVYVNGIIIEDTWFTREMPESSGIGNGTAVYEIPINSTIRIEFNNNSGKGKVMWFKINLLYNLK